MMPGVSARSITGDASVLPLRAVPYIPLCPAANVALRPEDELLAVHRLVGVELERLRILWRLDVEVQVIHEVRRGRLRSELVPPQGIGVRHSRGAAQPELRRISVHRGRRLVECLRIWGHRTSSALTSAGAAALPLTHLVDVVEEFCRTGNADRRQRCCDADRLVRGQTL